jgi:hypothetical protein
VLELVRSLTLHRASNSKRRTSPEFQRTEPMTKSGRTQC